MIFEKFAEFLSKADGDQVAYLETDGIDFWVYALPNNDCTLHFAVQTRDGEVVELNSCELDWVIDQSPVFEFVEPPQFVAEEVENRVGVAEEPDELTQLGKECVRCQKDYLVTVTPKLDLLIDGCYAQRIIEEYCPECGHPLIQRKTYPEPGSYEDIEEDADLSEYTWRHARR